MQHGKYNDRIYLMKLAKKDYPDIIEKLDKLALSQGYSKIFAKVPTSAKDGFVKNGYLIEAFIPKFYNGFEDVYFMGKYFTTSRMMNYRLDEIYEILSIARLKACKDLKFDLPQEFRYEICDESNVSQIVEVYRTVFKTYPFPIHDPQYIMKTMHENFIYFSIWKNNKIISLSSSEMEIGFKNVEMTDFATLPEYRGNGFAIYLLNKMEEEMRRKQMKTSYTISRAISHGINIIFAKMGYEYGGTLLNNTNISGSLESMNVWHKFL